ELERDEHRSAGASGSDNGKRSGNGWRSGEQWRELYRHVFRAEHHEPESDFGIGWSVGDDLGANFGATQGTSTVKFNGTTATPTSWSATSIVAPVPTGATTGNVVVTVNGVASNGVSFTVTSSGPSITSLNPTSGLVGASVTITG